MPCEAGLTGQPVRLSSASAMTDCDLLRIEKKAVMLALPSGTNIVRPVCTILIGAEHPILKDLVDQLFNSSGKRLAEVGSPMPFKAILTRS
jgi:hypothetical protein